MSAAPRPAYVTRYAGLTERRPDGSLWRSSVTDSGSHWSVIWSLIELPGGQRLKGTTP